MTCSREDCVDPDFPSMSTGLLVTDSAIEHQPINLIGAMRDNHNSYWHCTDALVD